MHVFFHTEEGRGRNLWGYAFDLVCNGVLLTACEAKQSSYTQLEYPWLLKLLETYRTRPCLSILSRTVLYVNRRWKPDSFPIESQLCVSQILWNGFSAHVKGNGWCLSAPVIWKIQFKKDERKRMVHSLFSFPPHWEIWEWCSVVWRKWCQSCCREIPS